MSVQYNRQLHNAVIELHGLCSQEKAHSTE